MINIRKQNSFFLLCFLSFLKDLAITDLVSGTFIWRICFIKLCF
ncbi:hypothetical protein FTS_1057 [Francisella tularensis subsp. holarctica FSC200]|nr:hypothetical protein FTH_1061 [Francisella tularensis subsp. holarctica OSU18]AFT92859.1 hypothetical protein FTS_1057 [Francisella tularensis subsp. holarctica FSC200]